MAKKNPYWNYSEDSRTWDVRERRTDTGTLLELVLCDWVDSRGERGPAQVARELHISRVGKSSWLFKITGPRGGVQEDVVFPRAGLKAFLERLLSEL
jgi:hypothetical protein